MLDVLDVGHHHAVVRVAGLGHVVGLAAVDAGQAGDSLGRQGIADRQKLGQVQGVVLGADDHEVEGTRRQKIDDRRSHRVLKERPVHRFAAGELLLEELTVHGMFLSNHAQVITVA